MNTAFALALPAAPSVALDPSANDDAAARPELVARITVRLEPQWPGTAPVPSIEIRNGLGQLVDAIDGRDGVQLLGEAIELCRERGLEVGSIVHADPPAPVSARVAARQRNAAQRAWQAWA